MSWNQSEVDDLYGRPEGVAGGQHGGVVSLHFVLNLLLTLLPQCSHKGNKPSQVERQKDGLVHEEFLDHHNFRGSLDEAVQVGVPQMHPWPKNEETDAKEARRSADFVGELGSSLH